MKRFTDIIYNGATHAVRLIVLVYAALIMAACSRGEEPSVGESPATGAYEMTVTLSMSRISDATRAVVLSPEEDAVGRLDLFLVDAGDAVYPLSPMADVSDGSKQCYRVKIPMASPFLTADAAGDRYLSGRIVAMANMPGPSYANPFTSGPVSMAHIADSSRLPMWGVTSVSNLKMLPDATVHAADITLLRSVAKISFALHDSLQSLFKIKEVSCGFPIFDPLTNCQPRGALNAVATTELNDDGRYNPAYGTPVIPGSLIETYADADKVWFYMAETDCTVGGGEFPYFDVTLERCDGTGLPIAGRVYLCDYANGNPVFSAPFSRLIRNHEYRFVISLAKLQFKVEVQEWKPGGTVHIELE